VKPTDTREAAKTGPGVVTYTQAINEPGSLALLAMGAVLLAGLACGYAELI
jgi:hypothetical protein